MQPITRRRFFSLTARTAAGLGAARVLGPFGALADDPAPGIREIDAFVQRHIREMGAPGLTLGLADRNGVIAVRTYGHTDVKTGRPVAPEDLFEIGSITKSFTALALLQLREQGKLDLNRPIREYLPWLRIESAHAPITAHHLLTHTSGLPNPLSLPSMPLWTAHAPGEHFHYCNLGYEILGLLLTSLDGRPLRDVFRARIFEPLGMTASEGVISHDIRPRLALSYWPVYDDRPFQRHGPIAEAPNIAMDNAAGCIASTPRDMALYMRMLLNQGRPLISRETFALFTKPAIPAPGFAKDAGYGYGIAIQPVEGRTILRHTGGMVSFSSAMQVDLDSGFGAFASVNASLAGYRPNAVAGYALAALRTVPVPPAPEFDDPYKVPNAADYAGTYTAPDGKQLRLAVAGDRLELVHKGERLPLERLAPDNFWAPDPAFALFPLSFERDGDKVVEVSHGGDWYAGERYTGPRTFEAPPEYRAYAGHYRNEDPWMGSARVILRKGRLWLGGAPLLPLGGGLFRIGEEEHEPDRALFQEVFDGRALRAYLSGTEFRRVET
ncbi:MAG TPA: serine hydrolase domain-containing protein [Thermoanaerobaculia bacterium]|nr:serine hydrolase domain-containing protein [Thermoanaerobaculia bacterium]